MANKQINAYILTACMILTMCSCVDQTTTPTPSIVSSPTMKPTRTVSPTSTPAPQIETQQPPLLVPELVFVPEGEFLMGIEQAGQYDSVAQTVYIEDFWIYKTEVTFFQFAYFLNEAGYQPEGVVIWLPGLHEGFSAIFFEDGLWQIVAGYENNPVENISWMGAVTYCEWAGDRLPTEEEWEKAARGIDGRTYPWGEELSCDRANYNFGGCKGKVKSKPVGSYPLGASPYGALDMAGNVWEWVDGWYYVDNGQKYHVVRGGSYANPEDNMRTTTRWGDFGPGNSYGATGFRCARDGDD